MNIIMIVMIVLASFMLSRVVSRVQTREANRTRALRGWETRRARAALRERNRARALRGWQTRRERAARWQ